VDEAFIAQTGAGGAGMILRDSKRLIFLACRSLVFCSSALESELQACLEGPNFSLNLSHDKILVETDSLELVQMATCKARDGYCVGHLVGDLHLLLAS
jgi:ribonuclease HI